MRIPVDLDGIYQNQSLFIAGGAPSLAEEPNLARLSEPGVTVLAINNTAAILPTATDLWLGGDKPRCYSKRILRDPRILKFGIISRKNEEIDGIPWRNMPTTFFLGTSEKEFCVADFLKMSRDFVWWKNTFYIALQMAHRFGFRRVYLIGCSFSMDTARQYSYDVTLTGPEIEWNTRVYEKSVDRLKELKPTFDAAGFEVISATPDSLLNDCYPTMTFDEAIEEVLADYPADYRLDEVVHSSTLKKPTE